MRYNSTSSYQVDKHEDEYIVDLQEKYRGLVKVEIII